MRWRAKSWRAARHHLARPRLSERRSAAAPHPGLTAQLDVHARICCILNCRQAPANSASCEESCCLHKSTTTVSRPAPAAQARACCLCVSHGLPAPAVQYADVTLEALKATSVVVERNTSDDVRKPRTQARRFLRTPRHPNSRTTPKECQAIISSNLRAARELRGTM
jgi:hypothetical protein